MFRFRRKSGMIHCCDLATVNTRRVWTRRRRSFPVPLLVVLTILCTNAALMCRAWALRTCPCPASAARKMITTRLWSMPSPQLDEDETTVDVQVVTPPLVQRIFETFHWTRTDATTTGPNATSSYAINYRVMGHDNDAVNMLLIHGFGANVNHFRRNMPVLAAAGYHVYAIDLLGFGASDKPKQGVTYSIELFASLCVDFVQHMDNQKPWVICGNSIGGLTSLAVATQLPPHLVQAVVLFNCAGGMTAFRYSDVPLLVRPILCFIEKVLLGPLCGPRFIANFKTRHNVDSILREAGVYGDTVPVDDELLEILLAPSNDDGAQHVFLRVFAGPPGPTPEALLPDVRCPVLAVWGGADPWTPVDRGAHPGTGFAHYHHDFTLHVLPHVGHCPHDEAPDQVHAVMLPWLQTVRQKYQPPPPAPPTTTTTTTTH